MITVCPRGAPRSRNHERSRSSDEATCNRDVFDSINIGRSSQRHSGPCNLRHPDGIRRLLCVHVAAKGKSCGNIVPHGIRKEIYHAYKVGRSNVFALPPQSPNQGPLTRGPFICQAPCHVAPHTGVRVDPCRHVWPLPCVRPTCALCGPPAALPRGLSAASHPRGGPAHHVSSPPGPAHHVITCR